MRIKILKGKMWEMKKLFNNGKFQRFSQIWHIPIVFRNELYESRRNK
jgi:hypothetical protein